MTTTKRQYTYDGRSTCSHSQVSQNQRDLRHPQRIAPASVGEEVPLPRPRIQVVHGTVPQKCARNILPARSGVLYRPAIAGLRGHPLLTSSTRAPEVTPN